VGAMGGRNMRASFLALSPRFSLVGNGRTCPIGVGRGVSVALLASVLLSAAGCMPWESYDSVLARVPAGEFVDIEGQSVHIERAGAGETVLLLHGFGGSTFEWRKIMPGLAGSFDVLAVDLNGFGYTERPVAAEAYSPAGQLELVIRLLDRLGIQQVHVVGHSYGAGVALHLAARHPQRVRSLVIVDGVQELAQFGGLRVPAVLKPAARWYLGNVVLTTRNIRGALRDAVYDKTVVTADMVEGYLTRLRVEGFDLAFDGFLAPVADPLPLLELPEIEHPALLIWGEHDTVFDVSLAVEMADALPYAQLVRLQRSGHLPMEEEPEAFLRAVRTFLAARMEDAQR